MKLLKWVVAVSTVVPLMAFAAKGDNNGKPFQELRALIQQNQLLIDANSAGVAELRADVDQIGGDVADIQLELSSLADLIGDNEFDVTNLENRVAALEGNYTTLNADLDVLRVDHASDMTTLTAAISAVEARIAGLEGDLQALTLSMNARLAGIEAGLQDNTVAIDSMLVELNLTSAKALSNMMAINVLEGQVSDLNIRAAQHEADIAALQVQIDALDTRISGLEAGTSSCAVSALWQPVDCTTNRWVWTSDNTYPTLETADQNGVLWVGDQHAAVPNTCSLDGTGWVSTEVFTMQGCNSTWRHIGGAYTGQCGGHDGDQIRRLTMNPEGCVDYTVE